MRDCEAVLKDLFNFIDNEMDGNSATEIKAHLDLCKSCLNRMQFEQALRQHCREKTTHSCPEKLKKQIQKLIENW